MADFLTDIQMFTMVPVLPEHVLNSLMMIMNCFCGMVDQQKVFMPYFQLGPLSEILTIANPIEPVQNLSLDFVERSCAVVITTTPWHHGFLKTGKLITSRQGVSFGK